MKKTKIGVAGCLGRMGTELVKSIFADPDIEFIGGFEDPKNKNLGKSIREITGLDIDHTITSNPDEIFEKSNVIIDFTTPESSIANVKTALKYSTPLVIGTTGLPENFLDLAKKTSLKVPVLYSENMSIGVNVLIDLISKSSKLFNHEEYDVSIYEKHHRHKVDSPSGTALALGKAVAKGRNHIFEDKKILNRNLSKEKRKEGDIDFAVVRAGEIAGEHTVSFTGHNDEIQFSHKAKTRSIFVMGAIKAAKWIINQKPGLYSMKNVLGL